MKKFFILFMFVGYVVSLPALANDCDCVSEWDNMNVSHMVITFDTGKADVCGCAQGAVRTFLSEFSDVKELELIGAASRVGSDSVNKELSKSRIEKVKSMFDTGMDVSVRDWNAGESDAYVKSNMEDEKIFRSVTIIPVLAHVSDICKSDVVASIFTEHPTEAEELKNACAEGNLDNDKVIEIIKTLVGAHPGWGVDIQRVKILELHNKISENMGRIRLKKWRNVDGSFNTARLASDSIAGVVLGTVGGVVTSSIIKKNQVKDGFEDLKCAIGGQSVASWGDEFSVGVQ